MFSVKRFERLTGHEAAVSRVDTMWSAQTLCGCDGATGQVFFATERTEEEAVRELHKLVYRWHIRIVSERQRNRCLDCGRAGGLDAHHVIPRSKGRRDTVQNLVMLCRRDHERRTNPT